MVPVHTGYVHEIVEFPVEFLDDTVIVLPDNWVIRGLRGMYII